MKVLEASIRWNTKEEGCLEEPFSGIQPSFLVGGNLIMSRVEHQDGKEMARGETYSVRISLPYGENYQEYLNEGMSAQLQVGKRIIATGTVKRIFEE